MDVRQVKIKLSDDERLVLQSAMRRCNKVSERGCPADN
jgi:hypothetical protein